MFRQRSYIRRRTMVPLLRTSRSTRTSEPRVLPRIKLPGTDAGGNSLNKDTPHELIQAYISYNLFTMIGGPMVRTMPGLLNWKLLPSLAVKYQGKYYVIYELESIEIELTDGSKVEVTVTTGAAGATVGYLVVKKIKPPPATAPNTVIPPISGLNGVQLPSFNAYLGTYSGPPIVVRVCNTYWACQDAQKGPVEVVLKKGIVEVVMVDPISEQATVNYSDSLSE